MYHQSSDEQTNVQENNGFQIATSAEHRFHFTRVVNNLNSINHYSEAISAQYNGAWLQKRSEYLLSFIISHLSII